MILFDYNQLAIAAVMQQINSDPKEHLDENLIRHIVLNTIRSYIKQFRSKYGEAVICCDSKKYWRRDVFPFYKIHRRKDREKSDFDWNLIFESLNKIRDELKQNLPYKVMEVDGAEADDIIAVLAELNNQNQEILIISSDKDFIQLQKFKNVKQYSPILKRFVSTDDPQSYIKEHIIRGDRGDGIPNFLSPDNTFVVGERQKSINKKKLVEWLGSEPDDFCVNDQMLRGYKRNQVLVDLSFIPGEIKNQIQNSYMETKTGNKNKMMNYFMEKRLRNLMDVLDEF